MSKVLVVAPHPDDETLGCGGTLLRHKAASDEVHWLIVTAMKEDLGFGTTRISQRQQEIKLIAAHYGMGQVHELTFPAMRLDTVGLSDIVAAIGNVFARVEPEVVYIPFQSDAHSDHRIVFEACTACGKWFRNRSLKQLIAYETLSETNFNLAPDRPSFRPNLYIDITTELEGKLAVMRAYNGEMQEHPFPRSEDAIRALANLRGGECGRVAAEAFMLLKEVR